MPPVDKHIQSSVAKTGKEFREIHEWLDNDPAAKAERHDITRIYEHAQWIEERYGKAGREEYIRHLHDDLKTKFEHLQHDLEKRIAETLSSFGIR
jgi:hypothetical protein